jgi:Tol biopolymer transport system component
MRAPIARCVRCAATVATLLAVGSWVSAADPPDGPRYLAFASDRTGGAGSWDVYLYDRRDQRIIPLPGLNGDTVDIHPSISAEARWVYFTTNRPAKEPGKILAYDRRRGMLVETPGLLGETTTALSSITAGGRRVVFTRFLSNTSSRDKPNPSHIHRYDRERDALTTPEELNAPPDQHKFGAISGDGRILAYQSSGFPAPHTEVLHLFDCRAGRGLGKLNVPDQLSPTDLSFPSLNHTGRYVAFGGQLKQKPDDFDVFVYDRERKTLLDTPGLNSTQKEEFSSLSADGRYLAIESMRTGNWDILLYDLREKRFLDLPGLNSPAKERHPSLSRE